MLVSQRSAKWICSCLGRLLMYARSCSISERYHAVTVHRNTCWYFFI
jgi:hypothetical protein